MDAVHKTPFVAGLFPILNKNGAEGRVAVHKATFVIEPDWTLSAAEEQDPLWLEDTYTGERGSSSILHASDCAHYKPATDIVVIGKAHAPGGRPATQFKTSLQVGRLHKNVLVTGDRVWRAGALGASISQPEKCAEVPLVWERAFGGIDTRDPEPKRHGWEARNPVGTGYSASGAASAVDGICLPNFEDPADLISRWNDRPVPQGFGFVGRHWSPRIKYAGTYDEAWQRSRMPVLPMDFDERFFNAASPDLIYPEFLRGGEPVTAVNLSRRGTEAFVVPTMSVRFRGTARRRAITVEGLLDTLVLQFEKSTVSLVWRARYEVSINEAADLVDVEIVQHRV